MRRPDQKTLAERRRRFLDALGDGLAIIPAARSSARNSDVEHEFRQDSDFYYLTGFEEPDAVALFDPWHASERFVLFVRPHDSEDEQWHGPRAGEDGARADHGADTAHPIDELAARLGERLGGHSSLSYQLGASTHDGTVLAALETARRMRRLGHSAPAAVTDPGEHLEEMRVTKSAPELAALRRACELSAEGHREAMRHARPGAYEYQVQAAMEYVFRRGGSPRNGYPSIVAAGANACVLHYTANDRELVDGDLLLIDAGAEYGFHTADITRTFPINGTFSPAQLRIYELVLAAQKAAIGEVRAGAPYSAIDDAARRVLAAGLCDLGLLPRGLDEAMTMHLYREFYPHGTGHWLGMDVHDVGRYRQDGEARLLAPGMVLTVEPGLYFGDRATTTFHLLEYSLDEMRDRRLRLGRAEARKLEQAERERAETVEHPIPAEYRGIGVRIEDDILVTSAGSENLTEAVPRSAAEVEALCNEASRLP